MRDILPPGKCVVLHTSVTGPERYAHLVANIAPSLQALRTKSGPNGVFIYRLVFAVRFAEFHQRRLNGELQDAALDLVAMLREDIAPKSWWAVLLSYAVDLLQNSTSPSRKNALFLGAQSFRSVV